MAEIEKEKKMRWPDVYKEFRRTHPRLSKDIIDWRPYNYATIIIYLKDRSRLTYNCITKDCKFI